MKKMFSMFLAVCLIFTTASTAFAVESPSSIPGLSVSESATITSSMDAEYEYFSIVDMEKGTAQAVLKDLQTGEYVYGPAISIDSIGKDVGDSPNVSTKGASPTYHQDTFSDYEYDIWEGVVDSEWLLERPGREYSQYSFMTLQDGYNWRDLVNFRACVDDLNYQEFVVIGYVGKATLNVIAALAASAAAVNSHGLLAPAAVEAIWDAIDATGSAKDELNIWADMYNACANAYLDALEASDHAYNINDPQYYF